MESAVWIIVDIERNYEHNYIWSKHIMAGWRTEYIYVLLNSDVSNRHCYQLRVGKGVFSAGGRFFFCEVSEYINFRTAF